MTSPPGGKLGGMKQKAYGFTIVELLIVIVVVAILAALSYVGYVNIANRANDSVVASDAATIARALEAYRVEEGNYPISASQFPSDLKISSRSAYSTSVNNVMYCLNRATDQYNLVLVSKSGKAWWVTAGRVSERTGATSSPSGVCTPVGATWVNDANNTAIHGYNVGSGVWYNSWITRI